MTEAEARVRSELIEVDSYVVSVDFTADPDKVRSHTEVRFRCRAPGADTFADLAAAAVHRVVLNGVRLDPAGAIAGSRLRLTGLAASNVLTVDAEFGYAADSRGLSRWTDPADGAVYAMASCFPTSAPSVCCCFDQPDLRADVTVSVAAPAGWECVSIAPVVSRPEPGEAGVWQFAPAAALHTFELTLFAGPYLTAVEEELTGADGPIQLRVWCRSRLAAEPGLRRVGGVVGRVLRHYEELLGVACPYREFNVVFPADLAPLAMQVPGLMAVNESLLQRITDAEDDDALVVLAHEVAHVWFGCLVDADWWQDLWVSEAMATYLSEVAAAEALGQDTAWAEFAMIDKVLTYQTDSVPGAPPVSSPVADVADAMNRPYAIMYVKGAAVIRQLAALIGDQVLRAGLRDYLGRYGGASANLADLVGCWSRAAERDLTGWAREWLQTAGVNTLRPELTLAPDGTVKALAIAQEPEPAPRTHRVAVGLYDRDGDRLRRRRVATVEITGDRTEVTELAGVAAPDALVLNDGDLTLARIRFDPGSLRALTGAALDVGDPLTEAVLWNAAWDLTTTAGDVTAAEFTGLVARRIADGSPPAGLQQLLTRAVTAADLYAPPAQRPDLRDGLATVCLDAASQRGAGQARPGGRTQRVLAGGFAAAAQTDGQLARLRGWLDGAAQPDGLDLTLALRGQLLAALAARGLATDADLDAYAADDPVGGERQRATCRARRPDPAAKETAWTAALAPGQPIHLARAHAQGVWVPGQEDIMTPYRARYFAEVLPALGQHQPRMAERLARLLYPATLADQDTIAATEAALDRGGLADPVRLVLVEAKVTTERMLAARVRSVR